MMKEFDKTMKQVKLTKGVIPPSMGSMEFKIAVIRK